MLGSTAGVYAGSPRLSDGRKIGVSRPPTTHTTCAVRVGICQGRYLMNIFIVDLKHQPGELAKATEAIAQKGINVTAFSGVTCGGSGTIALLTSDDAGTRRALN